VADIGSLDRRWHLLVPEGAVLVRVDSQPDAAERIRALPADTIVALTGELRLRRFARHVHLRVRAEYLALPSLVTPVAITQIRPGPLAWTARSVLTVPSGVTRLHAPLWAAIRLMKVMPSLLARAPKGERLLIGVRQ